MNDIVYRPSSPLGSAKNLRSIAYLDSIMQQSREVTPVLRGETEEDVETRIVRTIAQFAVQVNDSAYLQRCSQASAIQSLQDALSSGLSLDRMVGEACLVPYKNIMQFQPMYKGLVRLILQTGLCSSVNPGLIYEGDKVEKLQVGSSGEVVISPNIDSDRNPEDIRAVYVVFGRENGTDYVEFMTRAEIDRIRDLAERKLAPGKSLPAWENHYGQMAIKACVKRGTKYFPRDPTNSNYTALLSAIQADNRAAGFLDDNLRGQMEEEQKKKRAEKLERLGITDEDPVEATDTCENKGEDDCEGIQSGLGED